MAYATRLSNAAAILMCDALVDKIDVGSGTACIKIYDGTQPANPDVAVSTQTLLATLNLANPAFGAAVDANPGGRATANSITDDSSADATSTATWFRCLNRNGDAVIDGTVGTTGCDMNLNSAAITTGAAVSVTAWTVTVPET
jgi:hypothetical protein